MVQRPPGLTRTDPLFPDTTRFRSPGRHPGSVAEPLAFAPFQTTGPLLEHTRAPTLHRAAPARLVGTGLAGGAAGARRRRMVRLAMAAGAHAARAQRRNPGRGARERALTAHRPASTTTARAGPATARSEDGG